MAPPAPAAEPAPPAAEQAPDADSLAVHELTRNRALQAPAAGASAPKRAAAPGPTLDEDRRTLTIPLVPPRESVDAIEVRIRDAAGTRELRQRVTPAAGGERVLVELPREWLTPGEWTVEVEAADGPRRFPLRVR